MLTVLLTLAVICEVVTEYVKTLVEKFADLPDYGDMLLSLAVGLLLAFGSASLDLFALLEVEFTVPYVGTVLAGFLISRGSNFIHDFFSRVKGAIGG